MYDVAGLGSALMDFTFEVDDALLDQLGLVKGNMHLVDEAKSRMLLDRLSGFPMTETPGGSAANTAAGISILGGSAVFMGKVGGDEIGDSYGKESERSGLSVRLARAARMTGHAITLITPDSERTFATHLGAATAFSAEDVAVGDIRNSKILHVEGYMLEAPELKAASLHAMKLARECGARISIDLADPALVSRNLVSLREIMSEYADIIYANEEEAAASPLAEALFSLGDVTGVFFGRDFISVTAAPGVAWADLKPQVVAMLLDHFVSGAPLFAGPDASGIAVPAEEEDLGDDPADADIVAQIRELIETRVRPAVANDGGDIVYRGFREGVVFLTMQGACSGCPSSTATLKQGIESLLKHYVPEVTEVRAA